MSNSKKRDLYLVTDYRIPFNELLEKIESALKGGVTIVQYRAKNMSTKDMCYEALKLRELCERYNALFLVNDRIDVALAVKSHGVHIGQDDMPLSLARKILPKDSVIGVTVHNKEEAIKAIEEGADNLGVGALFSTDSKDDATLMSMETLKEIKSVSNIPLYGIGGINTDNLKEEHLELLDGVAVISALLKASDIYEKSKEFLKILNK
ncbi:thiamine phosphate synthase [Clostridium sp.]|uniref:thiamine phosphate synthase n=1 Tax=Clostridium sp. TaxID=1506 RepID=UPI002620F39C|nr:thiamine phosphate synthase [Clostridium sp.]